MHAFRAHQLMQSGPVEPNTIRELIVHSYWLGQVLGNKCCDLAQILAHKDPAEALKLYEKGMSFRSPFVCETPEKVMDNMRAELERFSNMGKISISKDAIPAHMKKGWGRSSPKKFAVNRGEGYRVARRPSQVSGRDRSPTG